MLQDMHSWEFPQVYDMMVRSFPPDEFRTFADQKALLQKEGYRVRVLRRDGVILGFAATYDLADILFLEHFAVDPSCRGQGLGSAMLRWLMAQSEKPLCLEVELPETEVARRRIGFYARCGLVLHSFPYIQPALRADTAPVPLLLMTGGQPMTEEMFRTTQASLLRDVYEKKPQF